MCFVPLFCPVSSALSLLCTPCVTESLLLVVTVFRMTDVVSPACRCVCGSSRLRFVCLIYSLRAGESGAEMRCGSAPQIPTGLCSGLPDVYCDREPSPRRKSTDVQTRPHSVYTETTVCLSESPKVYFVSGCFPTSFTTLKRGCCVFFTLHFVPLVSP